MNTVEKVGSCNGEATRGSLRWTERSPLGNLPRAGHECNNERDRCRQASRSQEFLVGGSVVEGMAVRRGLGGDGRKQRERCHSEDGRAEEQVTLCSGGLARRGVLVGADDAVCGAVHGVWGFFARELRRVGLGRASARTRGGSYKPGGHAKSSRSRSAEGFRRTSVRAYAGRSCLVRIRNRDPPPLRETSTAGGDVCPGPPPHLGEPLPVPDSACEQAGAG